MYAIPGFVLGLGITLLLRRFLYPGFSPVEILMGGLFGSSLALGIGEKFRRLPSAEGIEIMRLREEMAPIDMKPEHAIPRTLKTETEKRIQI